jgi:2-iminoacetate synthase
MTLKEYLEDYASPEVQEAGEEMIAKELETIPNPRVKVVAMRHLNDLHNGQRDFRF